MSVCTYCVVQSANQETNSAFILKSISNFHFSQSKTVHNKAATSVIILCFILNEKDEI